MKPLYLVNKDLRMCPACLGPLWSFAWSLAMKTEECDVYELTARCDVCNRYWTVGYSREKR